MPLLQKWPLMGLSLMTLTAGAAEVTLPELYRRALAHDSVLAAARASLESDRQDEAIARAGLLPSASLSVDASRVTTTREAWPVTDKTKYHFSSKSSGLELRQPLFDWAKWQGYREGQVRVELAEVTFLNAGQELMVRLAEAYFSYRLSLDNLQLAEAKTQAMQAQKAQATHLFKAGVSTVTDVEESHARLKLAEAEEIAAKNATLAKRKQLERVVGPLHDAELAFKEIGFTAVPPEPVDLTHWLQAAKDRNLQVMRTSLQLRIAELQASQQQAAHTPRVDLVASYSRSDRPSFNTNSQSGQVLGLQVSVPIFEGGRTSALIRQAVALADKAHQDAETARRDAEVVANQSFFEVVNGVARIAAFEQAAKSSETALQGMQAGLKAGLRSNSDVLNAYQQWFAVRRDLQNERYNYLLNRFKLQYAVGGLMADDLKLPFN